MEELLTNEYIFKILAIFLVILIGLFFLFKGMFKKLHSNFKAFFLALAVSILLTGIFAVMSYMNENQYLFSNQTKYYVYGKVQEVDKGAKTIRLYATKTTLEDNKKGVVTAKLSNSTVVVELGNGAKEEKIDLDEIKANDIVQIMCKESEVTNNYITAIKVVKRDN